MSSAHNYKPGGRTFAARILVKKKKKMLSARFIMFCSKNCVKLGIQPRAMFSPRSSRQNLNLKANKNSPKAQAHNLHKTRIRLPGLLLDGVFVSLTF